MQININREDGVVVIDGTAAYVDVSELDETIASVHFNTDDDAGEVILRDGAGNMPLDDFADYAFFVERWDAACQAKVDAANAALDAITYDEIRRRLYPSTNELIVALWELRVGQDGAQAAADDIEARRQTVKAKVGKEMSNAELRDASAEITGGTSLDAVPDHALVAGDVK